MSGPAPWLLRLGLLESEEEWEEPVSETLGRGWEDEDADASELGGEVEVWNAIVCWLVVGASDDDE